MSNVERCVTCRQPLPGQPPTRVCAGCEQTILRGDKYYFAADFRVRHRCCKCPDDYCEGPPDHSSPYKRACAERAADAKQAKQAGRACEA
ncbi:hypothetical protein LCGC14_2597310 [marine sediment metagenome]|uniref:Uncharacterized protein n=1 Tax=marine sediment metagenome TaxID=412755 RepID=A0A0F9D2J8_9ZZZZ